MTYKLNKGPEGLCPDCGVPSGVVLAGVLDEPSGASWEVSPALMHVFYQGVARSRKKPLIVGGRSNFSEIRDDKVAMTCAKCEGRTQKFHWAEIVPGGVIGQFCKKCLIRVLYEFCGASGMIEDVPIYIMPANQKILRKARAALMLYEPPLDEEPLPSDEEIVLF